jgi:acyl-CoA thioesterase FadM
MIDYQFRLDFEVRDYECDLQGIVNNAVYQNYLEHTRHEFLKQKGWSLYNSTLIVIGKLMIISFFLPLPEQSGTIHLLML